MSSYSAITLVDSSAGNVVFNPSTINYTNGVVTWLATGTSFDAKRELTFQLTTPSQRSNRARVKLKVAIPQMDVVNPLLKVNESIVNIDFSFGKDTPLLHRQDILAFAIELLQQEHVANALENFENVN